MWCWANRFEFWIDFNVVIIRSSGFTLDSDWACNWDCFLVDNCNQNFRCSGSWMRWKFSLQLYIGDVKGIYVYSIPRISKINCYSKSKYIRTNTKTMKYCWNCSNNVYLIHSFIHIYVYFVSDSVWYITIVSFGINHIMIFETYVCRYNTLISFASHSSHLGSDDLYRTCILHIECYSSPSSAAVSADVVNLMRIYSIFGYMYVLTNIINGLFEIFL